MEMGEQLSHSVNIGHGWIVDKPSQAHQSEEELDINLCVKLDGLIIGSEWPPKSRLTVVPASALPRCAPKNPHPSLGLPDLPGWLPWKLVVLPRTKQGDSGMDRNSKIYYVALKRAWEAVGGNKGFTATCLGEK